MSPEPRGATAGTHTTPDAAGVGEAPARVPGFSVALPQFEGPFDLLLQLVARKRLDVTELALAEVTDEFIAYMRADWNLGHASEFLVVASTLLALKAHRLLPHDEDDPDAELDLELLEARDLLFARLLQYRAFKAAAEDIRLRAQAASRSFPRTVGLPEELAALLPALVSSVAPDDLARLVAAAFTRPPDPGVQTVHLHERVPVGEQVSIIAMRLRTTPTLTFSQIIADADRTALVVARFLALLILHREGAIDLAQERPMDEITVHWIAQPDSLAGIMMTDTEEEFA